MRIIISPAKQMVTENCQELHLEFTDTEWPFEYTDHHRTIVRAIVADNENNLYFVQVQRDDEFGTPTYIETSGGGVEEGEELTEALKRELKEELGAEVEIIAKIGTVSDYYNLIHRHNINHYFLCRLISFGEKHLTDDEQHKFKLSTIKLSFDEAKALYTEGCSSGLGRLVAQRELPILQKAKELL